MVYDITDQRSFENINYWISELNRIAPQDMILLLAGNKCDLINDRQVEEEDAKEFAKKHNMTFIETSALDSTNVNEAFNVIVQ